MGKRKPVEHKTPAGGDGSRSRLIAPKKSSVSRTSSRDIGAGFPLDLTEPQGGRLPGMPRPAIRVALAAFSGLLLALSMPKPGWWPLAWVGLAPLLIALHRSRTHEALLYGLVTGAVYYGVILYWLILFGSLPWLLVVLLETACLTAFAVLAWWVKPSKIGLGGFLAVPAAWTLVQWIRTLGPYAFDWGSFAHTQANAVPIIQLSTLTGPWGIEFLVCLTNLLVAGALLNARTLSRAALAVTGVSLPVIAWLVGSSVIPARLPADPGIKVAIIQGNLDQGMRATRAGLAKTFGAYAKMSTRAAAGYPDLVVWPESVLTTDVTDDGYGYVISLLARLTGCNYIVGGYEPAENPSVEESYNAAHFYDRKGRKLGTYRKVRLVPYGEFVPLRKQLPWLKRYGIRPVDVLPGKSHKLIKTELGRIGTSICFESLFPQVSRVETRRGAAILTVITNDSWFGRTQAARQHMMMSKLRAAENRRYVVRAASTGVSAIIDPYGRTVRELGAHRQGTVTGRIAPGRGLTPYARFGDWFAYVCAGMVLLGLWRSRGANVV
jgi:apolipoprotein N-acyltransferase